MGIGDFVWFWILLHRVVLALEAGLRAAYTPCSLRQLRTVRDGLRQGDPEGDRLIFQTGFEIG